MSDVLKMAGGPESPEPVAGGPNVLAVVDHFAAAALTGILAAHTGEKKLPEPADAAMWARQYAVALVQELNDAIGPRG